MDKAKKRRKRVSSGSRGQKDGEKRTQIRIPEAFWTESNCDPQNKGSIFGTRNNKIKLGGGRGGGAPGIASSQLEGESRGHKE